MAEDLTRQLIVQFQATTELMRSQLSSAERQIKQFEQTSEQSSRRVEQNFVRVGQSAAAQRAGMQQLTMQIGDMATMWSLGARPMQIFASQGQQVIQAIALMQGGASRFTTFMMGPWGAAITAATLILGPYVASLFDTSEASKAAEEAGKKLAERQLDIANFFDASTGRIRENSRALIENAKAQIYARTLEIQAEQSRRKAGIGDILSDSQRRRVTGFEETIDPATGNVIRSPVYSAPDSTLRDVLIRNRGNPNAIFAEVSRLARSNSPVAAEAKRLSDLFAESALAGKDTAKLEAQLRSFETGVLDPSLRASRAGSARSGSSSRGRAGPQPRAEKASPYVTIEDSVWQLLQANSDQMWAQLSEDMAENWSQTMREKAQADSTYVAGLYEKAQADALERLHQRQIRQADFLAGAFETAFRGGSKAIWQDFENMGTAVISRLLAQFAMAQLGLLTDERGRKTGFNFNGALSIALGSVLGFADGGRPPLGRVSVVGERGPELFIPDVAGTIVPNHALGGGGVTVQINAPGATAETISMIRREIMNAAPALVQAANMTTARQMGRRRL